MSTGRVKPGLQAGIIVLQPLEGDSSGASNHETHNSPSGPPVSFVSSALQALKGILGGATGGSAPTAHSEPTAHSSLAVSAPSAPSSEYKDPIFHPPPPLSSHDSSYNSYSHQPINDLPPFKPLGSSNHDKSPALTTSYGTPISYDTHPQQSLNLQTMVDHLAESQLNNLGQSPSFNAYLDSFPDSHTGYSQKQNNVASIPGPLNLVELNKIAKNYDHKVQQRSDNQLSDGNARKSRLEIIKDLAKSAAIDELIANLKFVTTTSVPQVKAEDQLEKKTTHSVTIDKSVSYELRGNRIVRLTDSIGDA